jgi:hypothetical protein
LPIWDNIGRELRNLWEILTGGEPTDDEIPEETTDEPGGFFGGEEPPEEPPGSADFDDDNYFAYHAGDGPYDVGGRGDWGEAEERFWDRIADEHYFLSQENYDRAQEAFYEGFIEQNIDKETRNQEREDFLDEMLWTTMDWDAFEDYYNEI